MKSFDTKTKKNVCHILAINSQLRIPFSHKKVIWKKINWNC